MSLFIELRPEAGPALVVGGGEVALRKVDGLLAAGFAVTVVAPHVLPELRDSESVTVVQRCFEPRDIAGHALVFACTNDREVNRRAGEAARAQGIPVVVADSQEESTFFTPAVHRDGGLGVAVSTGGASPALAADVRDRIAAMLGTGWAERVERARAERQSRRAEGDDDV